jgi:hypothetical protein
MVVPPRSVLPGTESQCLSAEGRIAFFGCGIPWTLGDCSNTRSEVTTVSKGIQLHAKYGTEGERRRRDPLLCHCGGAGHFDTPFDRFSVGGFRQPLTVRGDQIKEQFSMVGLADELLDNVQQWGKLLEGRSSQRRDRPIAASGDHRDALTRSVEFHLHVM